MLVQQKSWQMKPWNSRWDHHGPRWSQAADIQNDLDEVREFQRETGSERAGRRLLRLVISTRNGKRLHSELEIHHAIHGKTHVMLTGPFSIANCQIDLHYQRVSILVIHGHCILFFWTMIANKNSGWVERTSKTCHLLGSLLCRYMHRMNLYVFYVLLFWVVTDPLFPCQSVVATTIWCSWM